ncbi:MAG: restriction endonuclease [Polyangiaceae bacterium]|nr:restriction endonuclease [Polyangiaceae bacterium]
MLFVDEGDSLLETTRSQQVVYLAPVESITELLRKLQKPGLELFEWNQHVKEIASRGASAVRDLLPAVSGDPKLVGSLLREALRATTNAAERDRLRDELEQRITPKNELQLRKVCIDLLADHYPDATHVGLRLLESAADHEQETREIRICALRAAIRLRPVASVGRRLLPLLHDDDLEIVLKVLGALPAYRDKLAAEEVIQELDRLIGPTADLEVRCSAIEILGLFGEIDVMERVCLLPLSHEREHLAVQAMVRHLLAKPRSVIHLNPKSFERLVGRLLEEMGYDSVVVQSKGSWDEGVDVAAYHRDPRMMKDRERIKVVCQCKRYSRSRLVGADVVSTMVGTLRSAEAARGVIITTSDFTPAARELARSHQQIELICGTDLQELLDKYFPGNVYRIPG